MDMQSLKISFFKRGGNVMALAENGSYSRCYSRYKGHVTPI
jgi:hypothetical protein